MILVTGATGHAGSHVVRALRERGAHVRAFVRDADRARERLGDGVELAVGDFSDAGSLRAAIDGAATMFLSCADDPRRVEWESRAIDLAVAAGVQRVVKLSTTTAALGAPVAFWDWHARVERHLHAAAVPWIVLRASFFMSNLFALAGHVARDGLLCGPVAGARIAMIDPRDVGAAAAAALTGAGSDGATYLLTGPEAITYADAAAELSAATGRPIAFADVSPQAARLGMLEEGVPEFVADQLLRVYAALRDGAAGEVADGVETLTGRPPRRFADFARDHAHVFAPMPAAAG
jgi:uncharacterized protein YbjT (DUF2867 family)